MKDDETTSAMANVGTSKQVTEDVIHACEEFVCKLHGSSQTVKYVNKLRHHLFTKKNTRSQLLPPNLDSLTLHVKRANFQAYIWRKSLEATPEIPSPVGMGWKMVNNDLIINGNIYTSTTSYSRVDEMWMQKGCENNICQV